MLYDIKGGYQIKLRVFVWQTLCRALFHFSQLRARQKSRASVETRQLLRRRQTVRASV